MNMRLSSISSSDVKRMLVRAAGFLAGLAVVLPLTLFALSRIPAPDFNDYKYHYNLYQFMTRNFTLPGGYGYTLTRFREVESCRDLDILFLGSSRCYYSFAPHVFERLGLKTFNLGSPSQTPLNTRYLLDKYYDQLNPRLVVLEVNLHVLAKDGIESFYDLMINTPVSWENARMSLATRYPHAMTAMAVRALSSLVTPFSEYRMQDRPMDPYLGKGAVSARNFNQETFNEQPSEIHIPDRQWDYLSDIIDLVRSKGAELILVVAPIPKEWRPVITNYNEVTAQVRELASSHGVRLYDFNTTIALDTRTDFKDFHHLNANGAKIFSYDILDSLLDVSNYRQALNIEPTLAAEVYTGRGIAFIEKGELDRAIDDYDRALALTPEDGMIYYNKARACEKAGRLAEAIRAYRSFIKFAPSEYTQYVEPVRAQIAALEGN
jgi:hypothetical protein